MTSPPNTKYFEGDINGKGKCYYINEGWYEGNFKDGKRNGFGKIKNDDHSRHWGSDTYITTYYDGDWVDDKYEGNGTFLERSYSHVLTSYKGPFVNGLYHGTGLLKDDTGVYQGQFVHGEKHGQGKLSKVKDNDDEIIYQGDWQHGKYHGQGKGIDYEGGYVNGIRHGYGKYIAKVTYGYNVGITHSTNAQNNITFEGQWVNDVLQADIRITYPSGDVCEGHFQAVPVKELQYISLYIKGQGTLTCTNKDVYTGAFEETFCNGHGTLVRANGDTYIGSWKRNCPDGRGKYKWPMFYYEGDFHYGNFTDIKSMRLIANDGMPYSGAATLTLYYNKTTFARDEHDFCFEGDIKDGCFISGQCVEVNGNVFSGSFKDNMYSVGKLIFQKDDIQSYDGSFEDGTFHGQGVMIARSGCKYTGSFDHGKMQGIGKFEWPQCYCVTQFKDNNIVDFSKVVFYQNDQNGSLFNGKVQLSFPGYGGMFNGTIQQGQLKSGQRNIKCDTYIGSFINNGYHGRGKLTRKETHFRHVEWLSQSGSEKSEDEEYDVEDEYDGLFQYDRFIPPAEEAVRRSIDCQNQKLSALISKFEKIKRKQVQQKANITNIMAQFTRIAKAFTDLREK